MDPYTAVVLGEGDQAGEARTLASDSDEKALAEAFDIACSSGRGVELWQGTRLIARLAPGTGRPVPA